MKRGGLKARFTLAVTVAYLLFGVLTYLAFNFVTGEVVKALGIRFAAKQALLEKSKLLATIQGDLSLSLKMSDSPLLKRWLQDEQNPRWKDLALEELENYRRHFLGRSLFLAFDHSRHYYFLDGSGDNAEANPRYLLNPENINDAWYFRTMKDVNDFELNIDYDNHLNLTKLWFNVIIKDDAGHKLGLGGGAIDISAFVDDIVNSGEPGVETILLARDGVIVGHHDQQYVLHNSKVRGAERMTTVYDLIDGGRRELAAALEGLLAGGPEVRTLYLTMRGRTYLAAVSELKEIKWFNLVLVDVNQFVSPRDFLPVLVILILSTLAVILVIGLLLNRLVLSPLAALAETSQELAQGNFAVTMPPAGGNEIGSLTRSFGEMTRMVRDYTENLEQKVSARTAALNASHRELAEANRQVMASIRYAQLIQASLLPDGAALQRGLGDAFVLYRPRDIVGGDFYYFREEAEGCLLAVIDCTGHGVPGAFMTMTAKAVLDNLLEVTDNSDPAAVLQQFNRRIRQALHPAEGDVTIDNGLEIGLCRILPERRELVFAGARINLLAVTAGELVCHPGDRQAIGYRRSAADFAYTSHRLELAPGTALYLASDGILDQAGGPKGWGFGNRRYRALLTRIAPLPAAQQLAAIEAELAAYQGDYPQRDDITVVGFKLQ